jgi:ribonuclease E
VLESHTHFDQAQAEVAGEQAAGENAEGEGRRDRRSRDRYGRDRRERGERPDRGAEAIVATGAEVSPAEQQQAFAPAAVTPAAPPAPAPAPQVGNGQQRGGLPRVQPFQLPVDQLKDVAEGSGLQWVLSDAEKIAAVQAAMAAEPKPVRVPRERPPVVVVDEGPLVLVETKRDLKNLQLPF